MGKTKEKNAAGIRPGESGLGTESIGPSLAGRRDPRRARDQNLGNPSRPPSIRPVLELHL